MLPGDLLSPQVFLHLQKKRSSYGTPKQRGKFKERGTYCKRVIRPSLDSGIIDHDNAVPPRYPSYSRNNPRARHGLARVYLVRSQGGKFEEGRVRVQEQR